MTAAGVALAVVAVALGGLGRDRPRRSPPPAAFAAVVALAVRRVGGYTGDVLGAAGVVAETVGLLVAAARW